MSNAITPLSLDDYFQTRPTGSIERSLTNNLYGINHRQSAAYLPINRDSYGLTLFVRPQLNLQSNNIRNTRLFYTLLNNQPTSIQRYVRTMLDPRLMYGYGDKDAFNPSITCPLVDPLQAFIPVLTNNLKSQSGWPDIVAPTFVTEEGLYGESWAQVDGTTKQFGAFDIDLTFKNSLGDPILSLFYFWINYQSLVFEGTLVPYPDYIIENMIDYNTRIYRIVLDSNKRFVTKIACTGISFPLNIPIGQFFDYSDDKPFNDQTKELTFRMKCLGARYMDEIIIHNFNKTVEIFNPGMRDQNRENYHVMVPRTLLAYFNNRGYARINPNNYELEWWVPREMYNAKVNTIVNNNLEDQMLIDTDDYGD